MNHLGGDWGPLRAGCCYDNPVLCVDWGHPCHVGCRAQCRSFSGGVWKRGMCGWREAVGHHRAGGGENIGQSIKAAWWQIREQPLDSEISVFFPVAASTPLSIWPARSSGWSATGAPERSRICRILGAPLQIFPTPASTVPGATGAALLEQLLRTLLPKFTCKSPG